MTAKSRSALQTENNNKIYPNGNEAITGSVLNSLLENIIDSFRIENRDLGVGIVNKVNQDSVQTTDDTETTLTAIDFSLNNTKTIQGHVVGIRNDNEEIIAVEFFLVANRASNNSSIIGTPDVRTSSTNDLVDVIFSRDSSNQDILVRVKGESAETYNWKIDFTVNEM